MPIVFPPLTIPPRPPELPAVPPPATTEPAVTKGPHLRNDAFLSRWVEDFERVVKDAWFSLSKVIAALDARVTGLETRVTNLEQRVSDTYTWGQKGTPTIDEDADVTLLALPLRVVRDEEIVECTATSEVPEGAVTFVVQHNEVDVVTLTLDSVPFVAVPLPPDAPHKVLKDDRLRVVIASVDGDIADVVVQARCR